MNDQIDPRILEARAALGVAQDEIRRLRGLVEEFIVWQGSVSDLLPYGLFDRARAAIGDQRIDEIMGR